MAISTIQPSFNAGEISPELYGAVSLTKYGSALTTSRNGVTSYKGGWFSRGGMALVGVCLQTTALRLGTSTGPPRLLTFAFSITQGYELEFGDNYLRFIFQGGYVVETGIVITGATQANPCQISVTGTPFANGDWVFITGVGGMTQLNGNTYIVEDVASGHFTLRDLQGNNVNSTAFGAYASGGTAARLYTVSTPYAAEDLPYLKVSQSADVMTLTLSNPTTGNEYPAYQLIRQAGDDWTLMAADFDPVIQPPAGVQAFANAQAPTSGINATFAYQVTTVDSAGNESVASGVAYCHGADIEVEGGTNTISWPYVADGAYYNIYRSPAAVDQTSGPVNPPVGSVFGFVGSTYGTQFLDTSSTSDISQTPPIHRNPFSPGQILAVDITSSGSGQSAVTYAVTTSTGSNFNGYPVVVGGSLGAFPITNPGENYEPGDSIAFNGAGFASGAIVFGATNPSNGDTITLNGVTWTFVTTAISGPNQTLIQSSSAITVAQLVSDLSASANPALTVAGYAANSTSESLLITYGTAGVGGDSYTLAASRATPSGSNLTGGAGSGSGGTKAAGTLTFSVNLTNGQTIILNGITWTFVTSGATGNQTNIGINLAATLTALVTNLTASSNPSIDVANYSASTTVLTVTYKIVGGVGNTYTLGAGTSGTAPSGDALTGGTDAASTPTGTLYIGPETGTFPGVNAYFQQRLFFANSLNDPDTFWASRTGLYGNFDISLPSTATDAITASPWTEQVNGIQWLVPMPGGLIAMTGSRAWQILGEGSYQLNVQPITPSTTQAQPQAFNGCSATIQPIVIDYDVLYVEAIGNTTVRDLSWNFWVNIYTGADLTILSSHLFLYRQITQWAWSRLPYKVLWACCNDGTMLSMTYLKEQEVYGWARSDTLGLVVSMASVTEPPVNAVYAIVQRFPPYAPEGIYVSERMDNRLWQSVEDAYAVDSGVSNPMAAPNCNVSASSNVGSAIFTTSKPVFSPSVVGWVIRMSGGIATITSYTDASTITGTWNLTPSIGAPGFPFAAGGNWTIAPQVTSLNAPHLAGMTVVALADGVPLTGITVGPTGAIPLPFAASNVKAGLPFLPQFQTPYLNGSGVVQGARKVIPALTVRVASSASFQYGTNQPDGAAMNPPQLGPTWTGLATQNYANPTGGQSAPPIYTSPGGQQVQQLWTGDIRGLGGGAQWNSKGQVAIQQPLPLALEITAVEPEVLPGDSPEAGYMQRGDGDRSPSDQQQSGPHRGMIGGRI